MHLFHDIVAAHELTFDINLREGWPVWVIFDSLSQVVILKHINILVILHSISMKECCHILAEPTLWHLLWSLHEYANIIFRDPLRDLLLNITTTLLKFTLRGKIIVTVSLIAEAAELCHLERLYSSNLSQIDLRIWQGLTHSRDHPLDAVSVHGIR